MNKSLNKRKNNNIKFDKRPENFQINMNNIYKKKLKKKSN